MRRIALTLAALNLASPAFAQGVPAAPSADDDLRCAAWVAVVIGVNKDKPEVLQSLTSGLTLFLGRYEAETGKKFEEGLTPEYLTRIGPELSGVETHCRARVRDMGQRLVDWGQALQKKGQEQGQKDPRK
ncbi:MAG TPA: hypothetical protein VLM18_09750 [Croceibacterium sp.]|nr:hypothetical protein [Croceibacterium sp.]